MATAPPTFCGRLAPIAEGERPGAGLVDAEMLVDAACLEEMRIPETLKPLIAEILFVEPPALF